MPSVPKPRKVTVRITDVAPVRRRSTVIKKVATPIQQQPLRVAPVVRKPTPVALPSKPTAAIVLPRENFFARLRSRVSGEPAAIRRAKSHLSQELKRLQVLDKQITSLTKKRSALQQKSDGLATTAQREQQLLTYLRSQARDLAEQYESFRSDVLARYSVALARQKSVARQIATATKQRQQLSDQYEELTAQHSTFVAAQNVQLTGALRQELRRSSAAVRNQHKRRSALEKRIATIMAKRENEVMALAQLMAQRDSLIVQRELLEREQASARDSLTQEYNYAIAVAQADQHRIQRTMRELTARRKDLQQQVANFAMWLEKVQRQIAHLTQQPEVILPPQGGAAPTHKKSRSSARAPRQWQSQSDWSLKEFFAVPTLRVSATTFLIIALLLSSVVGGFAFADRGVKAKQAVLGAADVASDHVGAATSALANGEFTRATAEFQSATRSLREAQQSLDQFGILSAVASYVPGKIGDGQRLLTAGSELAQAGTLVAQLGPQLSFASPLAPTQEKSQQTASSDKTIIDALKAASETAQQIVVHLGNANAELAKVDAGNFTGTERSSIEKLQQVLPAAYSSLTQFLAHRDTILKLLGSEQKQRYLLVFQNNTELRATGGFIGSYAILDMDRGQVQKLKVDDIYNPDGQLLDRIEAPRALRLINSRWYTHDANWFADFPTSAQKIQSFYEKTGGSSVDGVIAVTPEVLKELLRMTGPIAMPAYGVTIDEGNVIDTVQYEVEVDHDQQVNKPKQILADLVGEILSKLTSGETALWGKLGSAFLSALEQKQILVYFNDSASEDLIKAQGWGGEVVATPQDYLALINTNLAGGKTDTMISQKITHNTAVQNDGSLVDTVTIDRAHTGGPTFPSQTNLSYLRVYVPKGSELLTVAGFDHDLRDGLIANCTDCIIDPDLAAVEQTRRVNHAQGVETFEESGKTVFAGWQSLDPGESSQIILRYRLPQSLNLTLFSAADSLTLYVQKQPGRVNDVLVHSIQLPRGMKGVEPQPATGGGTITTVENNLITTTTDLRTDRLFSVTVAR